MRVIIEAEELSQRMQKNQLIIIDVRIKGEGDDDGLETYKASHIPGAIFLDVKKDVTGEKSFLPELDLFAKKLGSLGISEKDMIVLYDEGNHRAASKVWVALQALGHEQAYVLNGGFKEWQTKGYTISRNIEGKEEKVYHANIQADKVTELTDVKRKLEQEAITLIDSRGYQRYSGQAEPKYKKAGHIPGAINYEMKQTVDENGKIKSRHALQNHFKAIHPEEKIVVSCGSGNSACVNMVALKEAGYEDVALYAGGFSEWIEDDENIVATEKTDN